jgi:hypothetical protein
MLRINLLPPYIYEGAKRTKVTILWVVILLAVIGGMVFGKTTIDAETDKIKNDTAQQQPLKAEAEQKAAQAAEINRRSEQIRAKATFASTAREHANTYPQIYNSIVRYTWGRVLYDQISPADRSVQIAAFAPSLSDVGHYMMAMENNKDVAKVEVAMNSIPTIPPTAQQGQGQATGLRPPTPGHDFTVLLSLNKPIPAGPTYGTVPGGQQGGGGGGGGRGISSGMGGPGSSGMGGGSMGSPGGGMGGSGGGMSSGGAMP